MKKLLNGGSIVSACRNSYGRSKANGRIKSRLNIDKVNIHCDLLAEREVQDVPKHIDQNPNLVRRTFKDLLVAIVC